MSIDVLQEKIRKVKNPSIVVFDAFTDQIPPHIQQVAENTFVAIEQFCNALLEGLRGTVAAVRFGFGSFALLGPEGLAVLSRLLQSAQQMGYYVLLDAPDMLSALAARNCAAILGSEVSIYPCDGVVVNAYLGSDVFKPFLDLCKGGKSLFPVVRTSNKTAPEIQDLLTGGRLVHTAAADIVSRLGEPMVGKCGYSQVGALAAASAADSLRSLREKYKRMFLLLDGYDYPNANAKNCRFAFDRLGHGAAACAGISITAAWKEAQTDGTDFVEQSLAAAERMKKNLTRYTTVL
ncbi:MAG: hypothetical protein J6Q53_07480 [Oscillospiraceae bacterium]|nr:hypothetical protein [Oscillospiraceae bacterium]